MSACSRQLHADFLTSNVSLSIRVNIRFGHFAFIVATMIEIGSGIVCLSRVKFLVPSAEAVKFWVKNTQRI